MTDCPCGSQLEYIVCCQPYLLDKKIPATPEALMRSRYTAYTKANIDYIKKTMRGKAFVGFNEVEALRWSKRVIWIMLDVMNVSQDNEIAFVEFIARFVDGPHLKSIHERSEFVYEHDHWYYVDGSQIPSVSGVEKTVVTRNDRCPCGGGGKFKNCHGKTKASIE